MAHFIQLIICVKLNLPLKSRYLYKLLESPIIQNYESKAIKIYVLLTCISRRSMLDVDYAHCYAFIDAVKSHFILLRPLTLSVPGGFYIPILLLQFEVSTVSGCEVHPWGFYSFSCFCDLNERFCNHAKISHCQEGCRLLLQCTLLIGLGTVVKVAWS